MLKLLIEDNPRRLWDAYHAPSEIKRYCDLVITEYIYVETAKPYSNEAKLAFYPRSSCSEYSGDSPNRNISANLLICVCT